MRAGGCPLPALTPLGPADPSAVDFAAIRPGSSLQSGLKLLPKSTWIQRRRRRCLLLWRSCSSPLGLSWARPKASSPQVSGRGGVRSSDECPRPGALQGWSRLLSRAGGQGGEAFATRGGQRERCPQTPCRLGRGARGWAPRGQVSFLVATHCSRWRIAPGAGGQGCAAVRETVLFLGNWEPRRPAPAAPRRGREKEKVVTTLGTATLLLVVRACCSPPLERSKKKFPGKPLSERWRLEGSDLGALCQVLFVLGITSPDYCLTTFPSLPQSLSPPPAWGCSWVRPVG